jgi:hypothetical protein
MVSNLDRYKNDLDSLSRKGKVLRLVMEAECFPERFKTPEWKEKLKALPSFKSSYQSWYSEARVVVKQLLPDRLADFGRYYEKPKPRKNITSENYRIEDYLQGLSMTATRGFETTKIVGPESAIPQFVQQLAILDSVKARFESSLFDIRQLLRADLFDSELDAAKELAKHRFTRAAGAMAGVVLERHLGQVCENHNVKVAKKPTTISILNGALKDANVIDIPQWRSIQHLGDLRNLCDHSKTTEPTPEQTNDLVAGVTKIIKTLF